MPPRDLPIELRSSKSMPEASISEYRQYRYVYLSHVEIPRKLSFPQGAFVHYLVHLLCAMWFHDFIVKILNRLGSYKLCFMDTVVRVFCPKFL